MKDMGGGEKLRLIIRQVLLAAVVIVAISEGYNGRVTGMYFISALLMGGVDVSDLPERIFS